MKLHINLQFIVDLCLCALLIVISSLIIFLVIPYGFTAKFLLINSKLFGIIFFFLLALVLIFFFQNKNYILKKKIEWPNLSDFLLLALPLSPVIDYAIINHDFLNILGFLYLLAVTLLFSIVFGYTLPVLFSYFANLKILMFCGLGLTFVILNMAKISNFHNPGDSLLNSQIIYQQIYICLIFLTIYIIYNYNKHIALFLVIVLFFSGAIHSSYHQILGKSQKEKINKNSKRLSKFLNNKENKIVKKNNIYILVYESYANLEFLEHLGFDNSKHINFLKEKNFHIYHGIYSNSAKSVGTTSRILEVSGKISRDGRYFTSGNAFIVNVFKANGYNTNAILKNSYFFGPNINWDDYYPKEDVNKIGGKIITKAIFEGKFRFDIFDDSYNYDIYKKLKKTFLVSKKQKSLFFSHNKYPGHTQNSGKCKDYEKKKYFHNMKKANREMKNDVLDIFKNDKNPIIVLVSDHGPYLKKNCSNLKKYKKSVIDKYDIQDRYGVFLSIYWPKNFQKTNQEIMIAQDIFPLILSKITENKNLFNELRIERKFLDRYENFSGGVNVINGIIDSGKDKGKPLFEKRSYKLN